MLEGGDVEGELEKTGGEIVEQFMQTGITKLGQCHANECSLMQITGHLKVK